MPISEPLVAAVTGCPSCEAPAEPETEDGVLKHVCTACGYEFGFRRLEQPEDACALGIPEGTRRDLLGPSGTRQWLDQQPGPTFLGGIGRRPG